MKSLLVLSPAFPWPPQSGGDVRLFELSRRLAAHFDLHLVSYGSGDTGAFMSQTGVKSVTLIPGGQPPPGGGRLRGKLDLWRGAPHGMRLDVDPVFAEALRATAAKVRPDAALIEHVYMAQYRRFIGNVPAFLTCHNVETTKISRWFEDEKTGLVAGLRRRMQVRAMRRFESGLSRLASAVFATSDVDRDELRKMNSGGRFLTVANGADLGAFTPRGPESFQGPPTACFVGSLFYKPNLDAAMLIKNELWPRVRQSVPGAVCHIAGNPGGLDPRSLDDSANGVRCHGLVPDIRPFLMMSQMMIVPLRVGSGTRIKIIESMASGTPVVSTQVGAEGIRCAHGRDILMADTVGGMAECVAGLFRDRQEAARLGRAGRLLVESFYNWDQSAEIMRQTMMEEISRKSARE